MSPNSVMCREPKKSTTGVVGVRKCFPAAANAAPCGNGRERCISHKGLAKMDKKAGKKARRLINVIINKGVTHWKVQKLESRIAAAMQEKVLDILVMYACKCKGPSDCPQTFDKAYECYTPGKLAALQKNAPARHASILAGDDSWMVQVEPTRDMSDAEFTTMNEKFQETIDDTNDKPRDGAGSDPGNPLWDWGPKAGAKSEDGRIQLDLNPTDVMAVEQMLADPNSDLNKDRRAGAAGDEDEEESKDDGSGMLIGIIAGAAAACGAAGLVGFYVSKKRGPSLSGTFARKGAEGLAGDASVSDAAYMKECEAKGEESPRRKETRQGTMFERGSI